MAGKMKKVNISKDDYLDEVYNKKIDVVNNIKDNYRQIEKSIVDQLYMKHDLHGLTIGQSREDIWQQIFEMIMPKKFVIEKSVFIIDTYDGVSREVDLAIMDEMYTPYIFRYGRLKFIPIEAVAAVVECKSREVSAENIREWYWSMENLRTNAVAYARTITMIATESAPTQKSTRPITILCTLKNNISEEIKGYFDFTLTAVKEHKDKDAHIQIESGKSKESLWEWYRKLNFNGDEYSDLSKVKGEGKLKEVTLNRYEVKDSNHEVISLLTFNLQFNQLLMLINNPMLFPHVAYADMFNSNKKMKEIKKSQEPEKQT